MTGLAALPDAQLVARCRAGDQEAWRDLVERFSRYVYAICVQAYRLAEHDAEDVFQDVFARVYTRLDTLRSDEAVRPWIGQLTRRLCIDRLRSGRREQAEPDPEPAGADETLQGLEEAWAVRQLMGELPGHCQEVLDRFFCQDQSYDRIGRELGIAGGTIASRISRCLSRLRELWDR